jgi:hypothetical protein
MKTGSRARHRPRCKKEWKRVNKTQEWLDGNNWGLHGKSEPHMWEELRQVGEHHKPTAADRTCI